MRIGVHTSIAGGVENAAHHAREIGCDAFQMFSANPRGWRAIEPSHEEYQRFRSARAQHGLTPVVVHDNYLINLASGDALIRARSIATFRKELERALALGAEFLVTHPGSAKGTTPSQSIAHCAESLARAADGLRLDGLMVLIENTAGQGSVIGRTFEEIGEIMSRSAGRVPVGVCIDTAHCFEAGYAIHTAEGLRDSVRQMDSSFGLQNLRVIHANDSKTPFESHADRHEHIGKGYIGAEAFGRIVRHPKLRGIPFICETPLDRPGDDKRNIRMIRKLAGNPPPPALSGPRIRSQK
jgi:deoxyribonuclease IV